jgi:endonuclease YncB( thermonuclease family)
MRRRAFIIGAAATIAPSAYATPLNGAVAISGGRFVADGQEFHLADILAPSAYMLAGDAEPYFDKAKRGLERLLANASLNITDAGPVTRWGARVVTVKRVGEAQTLQHHIIAMGAARVAPQSDNLALIDQLLAAEEAARAAGKGLWALSAYRVFNADKADRAVGRFHLIEGKVRRIAKVKGRVYINFGTDYKTDFTASAGSRLYRKWAGQGFDLASLTDARLRIRGFVEAINGPSIALTHRRQIEVLARE